MSLRVGITGADKDSVARCGVAVEEWLQWLLEQQPYTHFLCLPLPSFVPVCERLQATILRELPSAPGLDASVFVRPTSLHLTLAMLRLPTPALVQHAASTLSSLQPALAPLLSSPLSVRLRGLRSFQPPAHAHVVYVQPDESHPSYSRLRAVCRALLEGMVDGGVTTRKDCEAQKLLAAGELTTKLHATLINTKHRANEAAARAAGGGERGRGRGRGGGEGRRQPVDASELLRRFGDVDWGEGVVSTAEVSALSWDTATSFYPCAGRVQLTADGRSTDAPPISASSVT